jgi:hypothetical protein
MSGKIIVNFQEGKERVIAMVKDSIHNFTKELLGDVRIIIDLDRDEVFDEVEDVVETIRHYTNDCEKAISKAKDADNVLQLLSAMEGTVFEGEEEKLFLEFFNLDILSID